MTRFWGEACITPRRLALHSFVYMVGAFLALCLFISASSIPSHYVVDLHPRRLPLPECQENPNTVLAVTKRGGHVAFLHGLWPFGQAWMDKVACDFLAPYLETAPVARL